MDAERLEKNAHNHQSNIMKFFKPKAGIPKLE
jgi:hypothetical protein